MKKILIFALLCGAVLAFAGKITVVLPEKASLMEKTAARELQTLLKKTSNVVITTEGKKFSGKVVFIGNTKMAQKYGSQKLGDEAWQIIGVDDKQLILNGGRRGVVYAVYEFLERYANVRFLDQYTLSGPDQEPVWNSKIRLAGEPSIAWRSLYSYFPKDNAGRHLWCLRSRQNFFLNTRFTSLMKAHGLTPFFGKPRANHTFYDYTRRWKNPKDEYFALSPKNGKRERATSSSGPGQICFTHPEVRKLFAAQLEEFIKSDMAEYKDVPPPVYYVISANDNNYPCVCANCKAAAKRLGNYTGLLIDFVNELARSVATKYPHVKLKFSAYLFSQNPPVPGTKLEKNVIPGVAQMGMEWEDFSDFKRTRRESLMPLDHPVNAQAFSEYKKWAAFGKLSTWDYWITWQNRGYLTDNCQAVAANLKIYKDTAEIVFGEIEDPLKHSFHVLRMYLIHRLWNNADLDAEKEIENFMKTYFGKASGEMKAIRALILAENAALNGKLTIPLSQRKALNDKYFAQAEKLFSSALKKAGSDKDLVRKIKRERINFDRIRLMLPGISENLAPGQKEVSRRFVADFKELAPYYLSGGRLKQELLETQRIARGPVYSVKPLKEFPGRKVIAHFKGNAFPAQYQARIAQDPDSETGTAIWRPGDTRVAEGIFFGYNDSVKKQAVRWTFRKGEFKFDGKYHWYRIGDVLLSPSCYVFAHKSWEMQCRLHELYNVAPGNRADIYIKLKAELDKKDPEKVAKLWMDGVLLLEPKAENAAQIPGFSGRKTIGFFNKLQAQYSVKRTADPDSLSGSALVREVNDPVTRGIRVGYYDITTKKSWLKTLDAKTFKFDGKYHWYSAGVVTVGNNGYAHVHVSTEFQQRLNTLAGQLPDGKGELLFRLKAELDPAKKVIKKIYLDAIAVLALDEDVVKTFAGKKIVTVYDARQITAQYKVKKIADKDTVSGQALCRTVNDPVARGVRIAYFDISAKKNYRKTFAGKNFFTDGKYHWYTLTGVKLAPHGYAHMHLSCEFQRTLNDLYRVQNNKNIDIAFRIKAQMSADKKVIQKLYLDKIAVLESK